MSVFSGCFTGEGTPFPSFEGSRVSPEATKGFDPTSGDIANRREFVTIRHGGGRPDGLTVDSEGGVWVATWPGYGVHRYLPDGSLDAVIPLPVSNVSSIELGGPDLRDHQPPNWNDSVSIGFDPESDPGQPR